MFIGLSIPLTTRQWTIPQPSLQPTKMVLGPRGCNLWRRVKNPIGHVSLRIRSFFSLSLKVLRLSRSTLYIPYYVFRRYFRPTVFVIPLMQLRHPQYWNICLQSKIKEPHVTVVNVPDERPLWPKRRTTMLIIMKFQIYFKVNAVQDIFDCTCMYLQLRS